MITFGTSFKRLMLFSLGFVILLNMLYSVKAEDSTPNSNAANIDLLSVSYTHLTLPTKA